METFLARQSSTEGDMGSRNNNKNSNSNKTE